MSDVVSDGTTRTLGWNPGIREMVYARLMARDRVHERRLKLAMGLHPIMFTDALDRLRVRMTDARAMHSDARGGAFIPLAEEELALLERAIDQCVERGQFVHCNADPALTGLLAPLRANYVTGHTILAGEHFRTHARLLWRNLLYTAELHAMPAHRICVPGSPPNYVAVLPWRAALIAGEVCRGMGVQDVWHLGCARDEQTLACTAYYEERAKDSTRTKPHFIMEPMLASGGTLMHVIERLRIAGVPLGNIVIISVVAAPEGVDRILHTYPEVRIVTVALDSHIDHDGYITGVGLGDFGDLAMDGVDEAYAQKHWITTGLLTEEQARIVLERTHR